MAEGNEQETRTEAALDDLAEAAEADSRDNEAAIEDATDAIVEDVAEEAEAVDDAQDEAAEEIREDVEGAAEAAIAASPGLTESDREWVAHEIERRLEERGVLAPPEVEAEVEPVSVASDESESGQADVDITVVNNTGDSEAAEESAPIADEPPRKRHWYYAKRSMGGFGRRIDD